MGYDFYLEEGINFAKANPEYFQAKNLEQCPHNGYAGHISTNNLKIVYIVLLTTLPIIKNLSEAKEALIKSSLPWSHPFNTYDLNKEMETPEKMISFLAKYFEPQNPIRACFTVRPERLQLLIDLVKDISVNKIAFKIMEEILDTRSEANKKLYHLTLSKINEEEKNLIQQNGERAKSALLNFRLLTLITLLFETIAIKWNCRKLIRGLEAIETNSATRFGIGGTGCDLYASTCYTFDGKKV